MAIAIFLALSASAAEPFVVHVSVALCDNASQGIVPVPRAIGDGNDPRTNLYWGASLGAKSWLKREKWQRLEVAQPAAPILERIVARKTIDGREVIVVADAWQGKRIRDTITAFLEHAGGGRREAVALPDGRKIGAGGGAHVVAYIGHDGLMEFSVAPRYFDRPPSRPRAIVLACASKQYFSAHLARAKSEPLLLTTGLMAPEAYTLTAAIEAWVRTKEEAQVREAAAQAYNKWQKCGMKGARRLFATR